MVIFIFLPANGLAAGDLELILSLDKDEYALADPISITLTLKNNGKEPVWVNKRFYASSDTLPPEKRDVYLTVISPAGEKLPCNVTYDTGYPRTDLFVLLKPGEEASTDRNMHIKHFFDFSKPGKYTVTATYENVFGGEIGLDAFTGEIESKPVTITIVESKE